MCTSVSRRTSCVSATHNVTMRRRRRCMASCVFHILFIQIFHFAHFMICFLFVGVCALGLASAYFLRGERNVSLLICVNGGIDWSIQLFCFFFFLGIAKWKPFHSIDCYYSSQNEMAQRAMKFNSGNSDTTVNGSALKCQSINALINVVRLRFTYRTFNRIKCVHSAGEDVLKSRFMIEYYTNSRIYTWASHATCLHNAWRALSLMHI